MKRIIIIAFLLFNFVFVQAQEKKETSTLDNETLQLIIDYGKTFLGTTYQYDECWKFKLGVAFDKTPTRDALRRISVPDQNRTWGAVGTQYRFTKNLALDVGYAHLFFKKANINDTAPNAVNILPAPAQSLQGTSRTRVDLVGIQLTWDLV